MGRGQTRWMGDTGGFITSLEWYNTLQENLRLSVQTRVGQFCEDIEYVFFF